MRGAARDYLERCGVILPMGGNGPAVDYARLAGVFMEPTADMPAELVDSLHVIHEMVEPAGMDAILEATAATGLALAVGSDPAPADGAVQARLLDRHLIERLHVSLELTRSRSFQICRPRLSRVRQLPDSHPVFMREAQSLSTGAHLSFLQGRVCCGHDHHDYRARARPPRC